MQIHDQPHKLAGQTVAIKTGTFQGNHFRVEDWHDRVIGGSWMDAEGNPAALDYAMRSGVKDKLPLDNEVLYGKIGGLGKLVHQSELATE